MKEETKTSHLNLLCSNLDHKHPVCDHGLYVQSWIIIYVYICYHVALLDYASIIMTIIGSNFFLKKKIMLE